MNFILLKLINHDKAKKSRDLSSAQIQQLTREIDEKAIFYFCRPNNYPGQI